MKRLATRIMDFCHWIKVHPELLSVILFSDEASFTRDGVNNSRNVLTWSHDNAHETSVTNFQRRFSVNVWCGVIGNRLTLCRSNLKLYCMGRKAAFFSVGI